MGKKCWSRSDDNPAHSALKALFKKGDIFTHTKPSDIYDLQPEFKEHSLAVFRNVFKELRSQFQAEGKLLVEQCSKINVIGYLQDVHSQRI